MSGVRDFTYGPQLAANFSGEELAREAQRLGMATVADKNALAEAVADRLNIRRECFGGDPWPEWWIAERASGAGEPRETR